MKLRSSLQRSAISRAAAAKQWGKCSIRAWCKTWLYYKHYPSQGPGVNLDLFFSFPVSKSFNFYELCIFATLPLSSVPRIILSSPPCRTFPGMLPVFQLVSLLGPEWKYLWLYTGKAPHSSWLEQLKVVWLQGVLTQLLWTSHPSLNMSKKEEASFLCVCLRGENKFPNSPQQTSLNGLCSEDLNLVQIISTFITA